MFCVGLLYNIYTRTLVAMKIIGFDPANYRNLGWSRCIVTGKSDLRIQCISGTFVMPKTKKGMGHESLWPMFIAIDGFLESEKPDLVVIEHTSSFSGGYVTGQISHGIGVLLVCCVKHGVEIAFVYPSHVKKVVSGNGRASKTEIKKATKELLHQYCKEPVIFDSQHACDATANILCWLIDNEKIERTEKEE